VVGAGAIGAGIGGLLWEAGCDVLFVARGANGEALARDGLDLRLPVGPRRLPVPVGTTADVRPDDLVLLATMGHDTIEAVAALPKSTPIVSFQNGLAPLDALAGRPVVAAMLYVPAERRAPGVVVLSGTPAPGAIFLGRWPRGVLGPEPALVAALDRAGFRVEVIDPIAPWIRAKALTNLGGVFAALCDEPPVSLIDRAVAEARACFAVEGEEVVPDEVFDARIGPMVVAAVDGLPRVGGSTRHALARGDRLETASLHGYFVDLGARLGVATPTNAALVALAERAFHERWPPGRLTQDALTAALGEG
jgi:2-dehydropantoate 2-reductase